MRRVVISQAVVFAVAMILAAAACGGDGGGSGEGGTTTVAGLEASDHGIKDVSGENEFKLELDDEYFEPTVLQGKPGQHLKLELENEGGEEHNLTVAETSIDQDVPPGQSTEVDVTFPNSGTLSFFCKFHKSAGMAGALETK